MARSRGIGRGRGSSTAESRARSGSRESPRPASPPSRRLSSFLNVTGRTFEALGGQLLDELLRFVNLRLAGFSFDADQQLPE